MVLPARSLATTIALLCLPACTVVKPLVCIVVHPIACIAERLDAEPEAPEHERLSTAMTLLAAPVLIPLRFVCDGLVGGAAGFFSGFASDLNVLTGHAQSVARNLTHPFRTNARKPDGDG